jgi:hypothetical protein
VKAGLDVEGGEGAGIVTRSGADAEAVEDAPPHCD